MAMLRQLGRDLPPAKSNQMECSYYFPTVSLGLELGFSSNSPYSKSEHKVTAAGSRARASCWTSQSHRCVGTIIRYQNTPSIPELRKWTSVTVTASS